MPEPKPQSGTASKEVTVTIRLPAPMRWVREVMAIAVWAVAFAQLLVFDMGGYLVARLPGLETFLRFRFLVLLGTTAVLWLVLGNRRFTLFVGYIVAYPFVLVFWTVPRLLFRNWAVVVAFSPAIHSILSSFRSGFVLFSAALIASFVIGLSPSRPLVLASMAVLAFYLAVHFFRRFRIAFSPSTVFADVNGAIRKAWGSLKEWTITNAKRPEDSSEYKQKFGQNLLVIYMMTTGLYIVGERLREVINSRKLDMYFLGSLLYTFFLTSIVFALEYLGLERLVPGSFVGVLEPGFIQFLGLSFSTLMTSDISPLRPAGGLAQAGMYVQLFGSLLIIVLLVFVILTSIRERYKQDLDGVVAELGVASDTIGGLLEQNYELTLAAAEAWLLDFSPDVTRWFIRMRHGEQRQLGEGKGKEKGTF